MQQSGLSTAHPAALNSPAADGDVADRLRAFLTEVSAGTDPMPCHECGKPMFIEENGVSHHAGDGADGIDHGCDLDHVAVAEREA